MSTKTGNPPVIDQTRVRIVGADGEVVVRGERGAIDTSAGAQVVAQVTNRSNHVTASAAVNDDGSFEVRVEGTLQDDYELTVTARGTSDSTTVVLADRDVTDSDGLATCLERTGGSPNGVGTRGPQPICGTLNAEASCRVGEVVETLSLECETNSDCVVAPDRPDCTDSCGNGVAVSTAGATELAAALTEINATTCADFEAQGCSYLPSGCPLPPKTVALCEEGLCVGKFVHYGFECSNAVLFDDTPTCDDYETEARCQRDKMLAELNNACTRDDDCTVFEAAPTCATRDCSHVFVVAAASIADAEAGMMAINGGTCSQADASECEYFDLPCTSLPLNPRCVAGACVQERAQ